MTVPDTNIVSSFLHARATTRSPKLVEFVRRVASGTPGVAISLVTQFELRRGMEQLVLRGEG